MKQGLLKMWYPDATDATQNLTEGLDAYYDEKAGVWVFPGEDRSSSTDPAAGPPPTGRPMTSPYSDTGATGGKWMQ